MIEQGCMDLDAVLAGLTRRPERLQQVAALAWLPGPGPLNFVLVTSRRTGRWVFPKGNIDPGMTAPEAARQEAREEAGVVGRIGTRAIGQFRTFKIRPPEYWEVDVALFPLEIEQVLDDWLEKDLRDRCFVTLEEARGLVANPVMIEVAERFLLRKE